MISAPTAPGAGIGSRVREARQSAGLTQGALAALVGVARHTVWCWEAGRHRPRRKHLARIALHCDTGFRELEIPETPRRERSAPARVMVPRDERMRAVLGVIARYAARHGYPPSMQEIMDETGFSSKSVVGYSLDACEEAGLIVRARGLARAVRLTEAGRAFAEAASETGSLPARREEIASIAPRAAAAPAAASDAPPPPVLQLREGRSRPRERTR